MKEAKTVPFTIAVSPARAHFLKSVSAQFTTCPWGHMLDGLIDQCLNSDGDCLDLTADQYNFDTKKEAEDAKHAVLTARRKLMEGEETLLQEIA